jgi:hypothetical protein
VPCPVHDAGPHGGHGGAETAANFQVCHGIVVLPAAQVGVCVSVLGGGRCAVGHKRFGSSGVVRVRRELHKGTSDRWSQGPGGDSRWAGRPRRSARQDPG